MPTPSSYLQTLYSFRMLFCLAILLSSFVLNDRFDEVIGQQSNEQVKERLRIFKEGGIENELPTDSLDIDSLLVYAKSFKGTKHVMGGTSKQGIDCSGLVMVCFRKFGVQLSHSAQEQARNGKIIPKMEDLKQGDMVFFYDSYTTQNFITHSGIYLGEGDFIHTSNKYGVIISKVNDPGYWGKRYLFGTRLK